MISKRLTAINNGKWETHKIEVWALLRNVTVKYLHQRKRAGYTDDETVNTPFGKSPRSRSIIDRKRKKIQPYWKMFVFSGTGCETYRKPGICN